MAEAVGLVGEALQKSRLQISTWALAHNGSESYFEVSSIRSLHVIRKALGLFAPYYVVCRHPDSKGEHADDDTTAGDRGLIAEQVQPHRVVEEGVAPVNLVVRHKTVIPFTTGIGGVRAVQRNWVQVIHDIVVCGMNVGRVVGSKILLVEGTVTFVVDVGISGPDQGFGFVDGVPNVMSLFRIRARDCIALPKVEFALRDAVCDDDGDRTGIGLVGLDDRDVVGPHDLEPRGGVESESSRAGSQKIVHGGYC